jgi:hypothetical protein
LISVRIKSTQHVGDKRGHKFQESPEICAILISQILSGSTGSMNSGHRSDRDSGRGEDETTNHRDDSLAFQTFPSPTYRALFSFSSENWSCSPRRHALAPRRRNFSSESGEKDGPRGLRDIACIILNGFRLSVQLYRSINDSRLKIPR